MMDVQILSHQRQLFFVTVTRPVRWEGTQAYSLKPSLQRVTGSQAKLAEATKEFIDSFTWEAPGEAQAQRKSCEISVSRSQRLGSSMTALEAACSVSLCTAASCFLPKTIDDDSTGRESKGGGKEAVEEDGGVLGRHPPASHGLLQQAALHSENLVGDALLCQTHARPQNKVCCTPCRVPNSSVTHLFPRDKRQRHGRSTRQVLEASQQWSRQMQTRSCSFFTEMDRKANKRLKPETTQPKYGLSIWQNRTWHQKGVKNPVHSTTYTNLKNIQFSSVHFSRSVVSDSLRPHESQHSRPPCPSPAPRVYSNSCPSSWWWHPTISSSVVPFSSCPQSLPASGSFPMSQLFTSGGQSIGVSASASVLPMNTQDRFPFGWTDWIS